MSEPVLQTIPNAPLPLRKPGKRAAAIVWAAVGLTAVAGCMVIGSALTPGTASGERIFLLAVACVLLLLPARIAFVYLRRRVRTGTWRISEDERRANLAKWVGPKAEKSIKRIDILFAVMSISFALLFSIIAAEKLRDLVHSRFQGVDPWFYTIFWVFIAVYWLLDFFGKYKKGKGSASTSLPLGPLLALCAVKYALDLVQAHFQGVWAWCLAIFCVLLAGSWCWGLVRKYAKKIGGPSDKQPDPSNA